MHFPRSLVTAASLLLIYAGCDSPSETSRAGPPARLDIVSGDQQEAVVGTELPNPLVVRVVDADGDPIRGQLLNFRVVAGSGSVFAGSSITNRQGLAQERWTLGTVAGDTQRVEARAIDNNTGQALVFASFTAVGKPDAPAAIAAVGSAERSGPAGMPLADSVAVRVTDRYGNKVPATAVVWRVRAGGGAVSPETSTTDGQGVARTLWTLGPRMDSTQVLDAAAGIGLSTQIRATTSAPPLIVLTRVAGDGQRATVATELPDLLVVSVALPDGRPLAGAPVEWAAGSEAGSVIPSASTTDHAGRASARWTLGTAAGLRTVTATTAGATPVTFSATAQADAPAAVTIAGGNAQTGDVGTTLPQQLSARVTDRYGNPAPGVLVRWTVTGGGGSVSPDSSRTDADGTARTSWTLGSISGNSTVTATAGDIPPVVFSATAQAPIRLQVYSPDANSLVGDTLALVVSAISDREVRTVSASLDGQTTELTFSSGFWRGVIILAGKPRGAKELLLTAADAGGNAASIGWPFVYDRPPRVVVVAPEPNSVARPNIRVAARCEDDDPDGCSIRVFGHPGSRNLTELAQGVREVDATVSLAAYEGLAGGVLVVARDSRGQEGREATVDRAVFAESSARWTEIASAGINVLDVDGGRVLYEDSSAAGVSLSIRDRSSGTVTTIPVLNPPRRQEARLTPRGAIFIAPSQHVYEWRDGSLLDLGASYNTTRLAVASPWATWRGPDGLSRPELNAGTTLRIAPAAPGGPGDHDVSSNGDVVFAADNAAGLARDIMRFRNGVITQVTNADAGVINHLPRTDGVNIVYAKVWNVPEQSQIALHDGTREVLLTTPWAVALRPDVNYQVSNGWVAYTKPGGGGILQVWTRAPDGVERQVWSVGADSRIEALGPDGKVVFISGPRRYLSVPPYTEAPVDIGNAWLTEEYRTTGRVEFDYSRAWWVDGELIVNLGRSAFRIN